MMKLGKAVAALCMVVLTLLILQRVGGGPAPTPEVFRNAAGVDQAIARGTSESRPVLLFATADWCGPCQDFKRRVLADKEVSERIARDFVPTLLDLTQPNAEMSERFRIFGLPSTVVLWEGRMVARLEGNVPKDAYTSWLEAALAQARSETPFVERAGDLRRQRLEEQIRRNELPQTEGEEPAPRSDPPSTSG